MVAEQVYRYPRWIRWPIEVFSTLIVLATLAWFGRDLLRFLWNRFGLDASLFRRIPLLDDLVVALGGGIENLRIARSEDLLPPLVALGVALLLALLLRNSLPTIRTSPRGLLIEFVNGWLPVPWESLTAIKVTEDLSGERFVLLVETEAARLTGWHRLYSLLYGLNLRRGFLVISAISNFDGLIKTLLSETDRVARVLENVKPARLQEEASSPLFRFLLGPASFFSQRSSTETAAVEPFASGGPIAGSYPTRITALFTWGTTILALIMVVRYVVYWLSFIALLFPELLRLPVFDRLTLTRAQQAAPWWMLVAAHLMVLIVLVILGGLRNLLPALEARPEGLAVRHFSRWMIVPWSRITAIKVTEFSEESQIVLIQASTGLPASARMASFLYDGSLAPGILITSALGNFEPLLQRVVLEVTRHQSAPGSPTESPIFQGDARSLMLSLSFRAGVMIDQLIEQAREDETTKEAGVGRILRAFRPMAALALPTALLVFCDRAIQQGLLPDSRVIVGMVMLFLLSLLEWPLVCLAALTIDDMTGGGEEGNRPFLLYPLVQLPRLLPQAGALLLVLLGVPILPVLLWLGAIFWSFLLAAGLWEGLYQWSGGQLLAGGLLPVVFQVLILLAYLIALR